MTAYGTYQRVQYQTVDLEPMKKLGLAVLKMVAVLFVALALIIVALTVFQMVVIAANFVGAWLIVNGWQLGVVALVFTVAWKVKP